MDILDCIYPLTQQRFSKNPIPTPSTSARTPTHCSQYPNPHP